MTGKLLEWSALFWWCLRRPILKVWTDPRRALLAGPVFVSFDSDLVPLHELKINIMLAQYH
ncbi:MAG: hypothetical protein K0Q56_799 [Sporolactobacillus laevolacticus]|jgi:hypothetical protein|nr:hypothetical protein [Sporolactobacillus laevolacticus]